MGQTDRRGRHGPMMEGRLLGSRDRGLHTETWGVHRLQPAGLRGFDINKRHKSPLTLMLLVANLANTK